MWLQTYIDIRHTCTVSMLQTHCCFVHCYSSRSGVVNEITAGSFEVLATSAVMDLYG